MKKYLVAVLLCSISLFGQQKTISIKYKTELFEEDEEFQVEFVKKMHQEAIINSKLIRFNLLIQDKTAKFYDLPSMSTSDSNSKSFLLATLGFLGNIYTQKDSIYSENKLFGKNKLVQKQMITDWKITNENKKIDNYLCYKATTFYKVINPKGEFNHPVTAWFCPNLPYSFGPLGYGGLPGLILELQVRKSWFGVDKIDFDSKVTFSKEEITKKEKITEEELNTLIKKQTEAMFKD